MRILNREREHAWRSLHCQVLCLPTLLVLPLMSLSCGKARQSPDMPVIEAIKGYSPSYEMDSRGRVVELRLDGKHVDDAALSQLGKLSELRTLSLFGSSVTDDGLANVKDLRKLESIGLGKTAISRNGLRHLERLPSLRWVWVTVGPKLSKRDIDEFKARAVPGAVVFRQ